MSKDKLNQFVNMNDGCKIHYSYHFSSNKSADNVDKSTDAKVTLLLSNSLGTNMQMWEPQLAAFREHFNVLTYDKRGHGDSHATMGAYSIDRLGCDIIALLDHLNLDKVHYCGLSIGGMLGQWLATHHPERISRLVLANTAAVIQPASRWQERIEHVLGNDMASIWQGVLPIWFSQDYIGKNPKSIKTMQAMFEAIDVHGYVGCCAAIRDMDLRNIACLNPLQTLIIAGAKDLATPVSDSEYLLKQYKNARLVELDAGHLSNIEQAQLFNQYVLNFLLWTT